MNNYAFIRVKRYQSPTLFSQSKPVISRYNPAVYTVYSQTKQAYRPYTSQNQFQPSQLVSNQFNPVYASEKKSEYQAVYTRYVPSSDSFSTNLPSYSSESDTNSFYVQDRSSSIVSPQYTYSVQSTQDNTQNPQTTYTYLSGKSGFNSKVCILTRFFFKFNIQIILIWQLIYVFFNFHYQIPALEWSNHAVQCNKIFERKRCSRKKGNQSYTFLYKF